MHFTSLMQILKQTSYLFVAFISIIPCISVFMVIVSISDAHTEFDTENGMNYNKSIDYMEDVVKKYIPFMDLETILSTLMKYREYIVIAWIMGLPIFIYNLFREDWIRKCVRLVKLYLITLINWFFRLLHVKLAIRKKRINQNDQDTRDYERDFISLCQIQYYLIWAVEEKIRRNYTRDLSKFIVTLSYSVRALEMLEERIYEGRDANYPPHHNRRRASYPPHHILRHASYPPHYVFGPSLRLYPQSSVAFRSRNLMKRLAHLRIPEQEQEQERPLPEVISDILDRLRHICQKYGQDLPR